ncbi:MAG: UDP-2,3-diacylglucosamine diphosphatase [Candidimonas sp.]|nr:MAG: UDP-2,3-diacylglucosamine diphosphatase [Candidimonas sp.]
MNRIRAAGVVWIASDIHLGPRVPLTREAFFQFLASAARDADALILCGDLFDAWIGDDVALRDPPPWLADTLHQLKNTAAAIPLWLGHGNRDFLMGPELADHLGARLLPDVCLLATDHCGDILLSHGDEYCIDDKRYQRFRRLVRTRWVQRAFLALGLRTRQRIGNWARQRSTAMNRNKPAEIMDVSPRAVAQAFARSGLDTMVHGHTHRPAIHRATIDGRPRTRIVLPDWQYDEARVRGGWLVIEESGPRLIQAPPFIDPSGHRANRRHGTTNTGAADAQSV